MCRLAKSLLFAVSIVAIATLSAFTIHAGPTEDAMALCRSALVEQADGRWEARAFRFDSIRGGALRKLTFRLTTEKGVERVHCDVRRGTVKAVRWPVGLEPSEPR